jgi:uncharacterized protein
MRKGTAMVKKVILAWAIVLACTAPAWAQSDPTASQIYEATRSGHLAQAEQMVNQVLRDHPRSAKAHYVAAEVYAKAGDLSTARSELASAEALQPGLPFARPASVAELRAQLSEGRSIGRAPGVVRPSIPWGLIVAIIGGVALVFLFMRRRAAYSQYPGTLPATGPGMPPGSGPYPYGPYGPGGVAPYGGGSGIMGNLATGLAIGAGVAAGEEVVHRVLDPSHGGAIPPANAGELERAPPAENSDMGGSDFGVSDPGSWDDSSWGGDAGGGDGGGDWT